MSDFLAARCDRWGLDRAPVKILPMADDVNTPRLEHHPVRVAIVGLGRIFDLNVRGYTHNSDVEIVALVDPSGDRRRQRQSELPGVPAFASVSDLAASGLEIDAVEVLVPIPLHPEVVIEVLEHGWHVNLQKPIASDLHDALRMVKVSEATGRALRVMDNYLFYEPLRKLKEVVESGEIGPVAGYHMKSVGTGVGGWEIPGDTWEWQFEQSRRGRGVFVFDDGWHKLSTALWLFGPVREVRAWVGNTEVFPTIEIDAPSTIVWEHENGIRGLWDMTLAPDMLMKSDYYSGDERWEVTGRRGFARVNRCTSLGIQQPSLEVYVDGEMRSFHALDDDWGSSFRDSGRHWVRWLRTGEGPLLWSAEESLDVMRFAMAIYASSEAGGIGVDPASIGG